jgi:hypothetical protein
MYVCTINEMTIESSPCALPHDKGSPIFSSNIDSDAIGLIVVVAVGGIPGSVGLEILSELGAATTTCIVIGGS